MSYLSRWRKIHSEAAAIALECSSSEDGCRGNLNPIQCNVEDEDEDDSGHSEVEFDQEDLQGNCRHLNRDEEFQRKVALNLLDRSLDSLEEKQKLMNALSRVGGVHLKDNVKRVMEK
ncbi:hypothetical protein PFLUV_G00150930 [Perca fluviatilis]|uniref:Uncharacterized protein n=1 Tax=Perca fluviatilis TaxID=8168 RepID=A0A6A5EQR5_PERFL|nr:hypothetical protein PFLUV_G00150930 [Perca fluviatilis]